MCTGLEIAALVAATGAQAGGKMMNDREASRNAQAKINARNSAQQQEVARQKILQDSNDVALQQSLKGFNKDTVAQNFGDLVTARENAYADNAPAAQDFGAISADAPKVVQEDKAKRMADQLGKSKAEAKALAKIGGTTDLFQNNGLAINNAANDIGATNSLARGSLGVSGIEQTSAANNAGNKHSPWGDILQAAGAIGSAAVSGGALAPAGGANVAANSALAIPGPFDASLPWRNIPIQPATPW